MFKAVWRGRKDEPTVLLGLTAINVKLLQQGQPVIVDMPELGLGPGQILIIFGEDEQAIMRELRVGGMPIPEMPDLGPGQIARSERGEEPTTGTAKGRDE